MFKKGLMELVELHDLVILYPENTTDLIDYKKMKENQLIFNVVLKFKIEEHVLFVQAVTMIRNTCNTITRKYKMIVITILMHLSSCFPSFQVVLTHHS